MKEKKNNGLVSLVVALSILLILTTGYIVYDKIFTPPTNNDVNNGEVVEKTTLLTEAEVKKAYYDILRYGKQEEPHLNVIGDGVGYDYFLSFLTDKKLIIATDISYDTRMKIAFEKLYRDNKVTVTENTSKNSDEYAGATTKFLVSDMKEAYEYYFGAPDKIDMFEADIGKCNIDGEYYICTRNYPLDGLATPTGVFTKYSKYECKDNIVYVYEKALYYIDNRDENGVITYYKDKEYNVEVKELNNINPKDLLQNKYDDKMLTYKYGFKQNNDGSLYLYSVEPVK